MSSDPIMPTGPSRRPRFQFSLLNLMLATACFAAAVWWLMMGHRGWDWSAARSILVGSDYWRLCSLWSFTPVHHPHCGKPPHVVFVSNASQRRPAPPRYLVRPKIAYNPVHAILVARPDRIRG